MTSLNLTHEAISRQLDLVPVSILDTPITVIGAGAIGSWVVLALAKSGFTSIGVFDHDRVDIVNMSSQFFGIDDVGRLKVEALAERVEEMTGEMITAIPEKWTGMKMRGITIMAADSMAVRREIFEAHRSYIPSSYLIDARMGAETALMYVVDPNVPKDCESYLKTLYSDAEAVQERCTAKSTTYCSLFLSSLVVKSVRDVLVKGKYARNLQVSLKENDWLCWSQGENVAKQPQVE